MMQAPQFPQNISVHPPALSSSIASLHSFGGHLLIKTFHIPADSEDFKSFVFNLTSCLHRNLIVGILLLSTLSLLTYLISSWSFVRRTSFHTNKAPRTTAVVPYWFPIIGHGLSLGWDPASYVSSVVSKYGWEKPVRILAGPTISFTIVSNPSHMRSILRNSRLLHNRPNIIFTMQKLLGAPSKTMKFYWADDSGMSAVPRHGSTTADENRIHYHQAHTSQKFLSGSQLQFLSRHYLNTFDRILGDSLDIQDEWVQFPDLYKFLKHHIIQASTETVMGTKILEIMPDLVNDFLEFEGSYPYYFRMWPSWLIRRASRSRERLIRGIEKWHEYALQHADISKTEPEDPNWEPIFGTKYMKARQAYWKKMKPMDARTRACEDLGLIFGLNANTLPCIFWFVFEALKNKSLQAHLGAEVSATRTADEGIDISKLTSQPLLQSTYTEVLRKYVDIFLTRTTGYGDVKFDDYTLPKGENLIVYSGVSHFNAEAWAQAGRPQQVPLEEFSAERFLVYDTAPLDETTPDDMSGPSGSVKKPTRTASSAPRFSMSGLSNLWFPFGGGEHLCPGRLFAKAEVLITYAILFTKYDIEMVMQEPSAVQPNRHYAPFGALPPTGPKVPFRIRRRRAKD